MKKLIEIISPNFCLVREGDIMYNIRHGVQYTVTNCTNEYVPGEGFIVYNISITDGKNISDVLSGRESERMATYILYREIELPFNKGLIWNT